MFVLSLLPNGSKSIHDAPKALKKSTKQDIKKREKESVYTDISSFSPPF